MNPDKWQIERSLGMKEKQVQLINGSFERSENGNVIKLTFSSPQRITAQGLISALEQLMVQVLSDEGHDIEGDE